MRHLKLSHRPNLVSVRYPAWVKLLSNDFAFLSSASRLFSHYIQEKGAQYIPNCNLAAAFHQVFVRGGYVLDVEEALEEEHQKLLLAAEQRELDEMKATLDFGKPIESLPEMTMEEFKAVGKGSTSLYCSPPRSPLASTETLCL